MKREVAVRRMGDEVSLVIRESVREERINGSCWTVCHQDDIARMFNVWVLRLPVDEASVILNGLIEAGVGTRADGSEGCPSSLHRRPQVDPTEVGR